MGIQVFSRCAAYVGADGGTAAPAADMSAVNVRIPMARLSMELGLTLVPHVIQLLFLGALERLPARVGCRSQRTRRPEREIAIRDALRFTVHGLDARLDFEQHAARQRPLMLVGLVHGPYGVIEEGDSGLLDVVAEYVSEELAFRETQHASIALLKSGQILYV